MSAETFPVDRFCRLIVPLCAVVALSVLPGVVLAAERLDHGLLDSVLARFVDGDGRVDYAGLKRDPEQLDRYCARLAETSPANTPGAFPARADSLAYWINAYNALVLKGVTEAYPVASVKDIRLFYGFFKRQEFVVGGREVTLDDIEHGTIREQFLEPRIHAVVNCGAVSCPKLRTSALTVANLESQLDLAMREFAGSDAHVQLDRAARVTRLSRLFDWYGSDFTDWIGAESGQKRSTVLDYVAQYRDADDQAFLLSSPRPEIRFLDYDWALNDQATVE